VFNSGNGNDTVVTFHGGVFNGGNGKDTVVTFLGLGVVDLCVDVEIGAPRCP